MKKETKWVKLRSIQFNEDCRLLAVEISDSCSVPSYLELDEPFTELNSFSPKGVGGIADSIYFPPSPPKPGLIRKVSLSTALLFLHLMTWSIQLADWVLKICWGQSHEEKKFYKEFDLLLKTGKKEEIENFLKNQEKTNQGTSYVFHELICFSVLYPHLPEVLKGANVCLVNDHGFFCRRWKEHPASCPRISSHQYQKGECYAIGHFLFWLDPEGNTRFQIENSPLQGLFNRVYHFIDYVRYRRDNEQQGVIGTSPYTEEFCIQIPVDSTLLRE